MALIIGVSAVNGSTRFVHLRGIENVLGVDELGVFSVGSAVKVPWFTCLTLSDTAQITPLVERLSLGGTTLSIAESYRVRSGDRIKFQDYELRLGVTSLIAEARARSLLRPDLRQRPPRFSLSIVLWRYRNQITLPVGAVCSIGSDQTDGIFLDIPGVRPRHVTLEVTEQGLTVMHHAGEVHTSTGRQEIADRETITLLPLGIPVMARSCLAPQ